MTSIGSTLATTASHETGRKCRPLSAKMQTDAGRLVAREPLKTRHKAPNLPLAADDAATEEPPCKFTALVGHGCRSAKVPATTTAADRAGS